MANKPKNWDLLSPVEQEAWRVERQVYQRKYFELNSKKVREQRRKYREANPEKAQKSVIKSVRKYREANPEKHREAVRKWKKANLEKVREINQKSKRKSRQQSAADQFFIMAGAAEQLTKLKPKQ